MWQNMAMTKKMIGWKLFNAVSTSRKLPVNGRLLLPFHDAVLVVREQHALQPLALGVASAQVFRVVDPLHVSTAQSVLSSFQLVF